MVNKITVKSIAFGVVPFRKLKKTSIEFSNRITLIAGHNGIGKSTILGLLSGTFGLTESKLRSYFLDPFYTNIERIIYVALSEVDAQQQDPASAPVVIADISGHLHHKRCSLTRRSEWRRARLVPRTIDPVDGDNIGPDAKIPLPTIFLGMKRLASVGEADEKDVTSTPASQMDEVDRELIADFVNSVILGSDATSEIERHSIRGIKKRSTHPKHRDHDSLAISLGQDSLGSIATALASFSRLKRDMGDDYPGGLLIVDEIDIGLHPHAIDRLVKALKTYANKLQLQIIGTTHSPRMIEAVHPEGQGHENSPDSVIYLVDTKRPRLAEDQSLDAILKDMALDLDEEDQAAQLEPLCIYFEDQEGRELCDALFSVGMRRALSRKIGRPIKLIPLGVGGSSLLALPNKDPIFSRRVLIVDSDTMIPKKTRERGNSLKLPCTPGAGGVHRSPENMIKDFLRGMASAEDDLLRDALLKLKTPNPSSNKIERVFFLDGDGASTGRDASKRWWRKHWDTLNKWAVLPLWATTYPDQANSFRQEFEAIATRTAALLPHRMAKS